ncbi:MAG: ParB N-terminal domain-containing protein [Brevundimonas sp.]|jgi:hypothetical protein
MDPVKIAFEQRVHVLPLDQILPSKMLSAAVIDSPKYKRIAASVAEVGLVEPLVVAQVRSGNAHPLLDGHVRLSILKELGVETARCVVSSDDESFTYNKRVNRLPPIRIHGRAKITLQRLSDSFAPLATVVALKPRSDAPGRMLLTAALNQK